MKNKTNKSPALTALEKKIKALQKKRDANDDACRKINTELGAALEARIKELQIELFKHLKKGDWRKDERSKLGNPRTTFTFFRVGKIDRKKLTARATRVTITRHLGGQGSTFPPFISVTTDSIPLPVEAACPLTKAEARLAEYCLTSRNNTKAYLDSLAKNAN